MFKNKSLNRFKKYTTVYKKIADVVPGDIVLICKDSNSVEKWFEIDKVESQGNLVELFFKDGESNCKVLLWACNYYLIKTLEPIKK